MTHPDAFGTLIGPIRAARMDSFPYMILYEHDPPVIYFGGLYHVAADPNRWPARPSPYRSG